MAKHKGSGRMHRQIGTAMVVVLAAATAGWGAEPAPGKPPAKVTLTAPPTAPTKSANSAVRAKLDSIIIPSLTAEERPAREVFDLLIKAGREQDPAKVGVNVFFKCPADALNKHVTVAFDKITLGDALLYLCKVCGLDYTIEEYAVSVFAKTQP